MPGHGRWKISAGTFCEASNSHILMRETLAAAMLLALGYDGSVPLVDAMCGAGTIPIEGALIARQMAPGLGRTFRCEHWPVAGKRPGAAAVREKAAALMIPPA